VDRESLTELVVTRAM